MLSYKKIGTGYPLVLIHGYLGGQSMWKFQEELKNDIFRKPIHMHAMKLHLQYE